MRIAELSRLSGVSTASVKFYSREGLLPAGERTGYNQTDYTERHLTRLRLIRSLIEVGGLSVADTRRVLAATDDPALAVNEVLAVAQGALPRAAAPPSPGALARVRALAVERGWHVEDANPGLTAAAGVLDSYGRLDRDDLADVLSRYAEAAELVAEADLDLVAATAGDRDRTAQTVVVGTVLGDTLLAGLRRMTQEHVASQRYQGTGTPAPRGDPDGRHAHPHPQDRPPAA